MSAMLLKDSVVGNWVMTILIGLLALSTAYTVGYRRIARENDEQQLEIAKLRSDLTVVAAALDTICQYGTRMASVVASLQDCLPFADTKGGPMIYTPNKDRKPKIVNGHKVWMNEGDREHENEAAERLAGAWKVGVVVTDRFDDYDFLFLNDDGVLLGIAEFKWRDMSVTKFDTVWASTAKVEALLKAKQESKGVRAMYIFSFRGDLWFTYAYTCTKYPVRICGNAERKEREPCYQVPMEILHKVKGVT